MVANGSYAAGRLYKTVTKDENWQPTQTYLKDHTTEEFKDLQGRVILKRTYNSTPPSGEAEGVHDTYYVYDDFGNLTYVIPPKVVTSDGVSATELSELCYQYKYDHRNRLIEKKIPGKGWEYIVYNKLDQPILTQDANLQAQSKWLFTRYDAFGRVVYTGLISSASVRITLQTEADAVVTQFESRTAAATLAGTTVYYSNTAYPTAGITELHTLNYYDDYAFDLGGLSAPPVSVYSQTLLTGTQLRGLPTGSKVRVLGTANWTTTLTGYDSRKRPVWTASKNTYLGTTDFVEIKLNYIGWAEEVKNIHQKTGQTDLVVVEKFTYDHAGKVLTQTHQINSNPAQRIADNAYGQLGQLKKKNVGGKTIQAALQNVDYTYNIRGWLKQINDVSNLGSNDLFGFALNYNTVGHSGTALYNGNIAETEWRTANTDNSLKWYKYGYDPLNRITNATDNTGNYSLSNVTYDKNGNIQTLARNGWQNSGIYANMDVLDYDYDSGNKLLKVTDTGNNGYGFKDGTNTSNDYAYDLNGNMVQNLNKGITNVAYNHLNMPANITVTGSNAGTLGYVYDATGIKLRKANNNGTTTDYIGNFVYENGNLKQISHAEGYIEPNGSTYQYVYYLKDHQNNVRVTFADDNNNGIIETGSSYSEIRREQNYFPFGMEHRGYNNVTQGAKNNLKTYQDQEFTEDLGLDTHEWKFRISDPAIGRFWQIDPLAEDYVYNSTYAFSENKVISHIELEGLEAVWSAAQAARDPKTDEFVQENPGTAATILAAFLAPVVILEVGLEAVATFVVNEIKDEVLSQATGGASDALDLTKAGAKIVKEGVKTITEKGIKNSSKYDDITKSSRGKPSTTNKQTDVTKVEFEKNLEKSGFEKTTSKDGKTTTLSKDGKSYTIRDSKDKTATADFRKSSSSKKADTKIRLEKDKP